MPNHYNIPFNTDKASIRYYTYFELFISKLKILKHLGKFKAGKAVIIKKNVDIRITENGILEVDDHSVFEIDSQLVLTKPKPIIQIGKNVLIGKGSLVFCKNKIKIGSNTRIGAYTTIRDHIHKNVSRKNTVIKSNSFIKEVLIGEDVWIGNYCTILPGVKIGNGSIVATYALVDKNVPSGVLVAGQPARIIKKI
jgi:acetyltransferase-like isoleucine patch superfamily enzyme